MEHSPFLYAQPWQYFAPFWVVVCLQSLHFDPYGVNRFFDPPTEGGPNVVFEGPGRDNKAFPPPTFLVPSLIALEEDMKGSGAATFDSFFSHFLQTMV